MTGEHVETLAAVLHTLPAGPERRRLQELLVWVTNAYTAQLAEQARVALSQEQDRPLVHSDLLVVEQLMRKGIQHNGVVPELSAPDVARGVSIITGLLSRSAASTLTQEDQEVLQWVFDTAAQDPQRTPFVRRVESMVRAGLGVEQRPVWNHNPRQPLS